MLLQVTKRTAKMRVLLAAISLLGITVSAGNEETVKVPDGFKFGVSTAAYQIEGGWNVSDKGVSVWDHFTHQHPSPIQDGSTGDVASDAFHKYKEDIALLKNLGVDFYRFSLSWARILPEGFAHKVSQDGIQYYKNLLDDLHAMGIEPVVTIHHWDHPYVLEEMGGWTNELMVTWYADYARVVFRELGSRIKIFGTINEPTIICAEGYGSGGKAPGKKYPSHAPYLCMHNMLKAHAKAYRIYDTEFRKTQGGQIGLVIPCASYYAKYPNDTETPDVQAAFAWGWAAHPIYSKEGDYPAVMKQRIAENSRLEGYPRSRLPEFTQAEIEEIRGTADYFGLNHYLSKLTEPAPKSETTPWYDDSGVLLSFDPSWPHYKASSWLRVVPKGFGDIVRQIKSMFDNPPIYIMENGIADDGSSLDDQVRIGYLHDYLRELLKAVNEDNCNVKMYGVWSFLDNFEWEQGHTDHFGMVSVDFNNPSRTRTPKSSYKWYQELIRSRQLPPVDIARR